MKSECKIDADGTKRWYLNGKRHREDGPAIEYADGHKEWWLNGKRHRIDSPAIEYSSGSKCWYLNNQRIECSTQQEFEQLMRLKAFW